MIKTSVSPYRWIVLLCLLPILATTNLFWLTFAPITGLAENYYDVSSLSIAFLSMSFMIVYILMVLPASWMIDTYGFRVAVGFGAIITAGFGIVRGLWGDHFTIVVIAQIGVAVGQPFLMNSITKVAARWFPVDERATASGIAMMAGSVGMILALILTPILVEQYGIKQMLNLYGMIALGSTLLFLIFAKERPKISLVSNETEEQSFSFRGLKEMMTKKNFLMLMICVFIVLGIFNAIMTWIESILSPRGISASDAGLVGGLLVIFGLLGSVILPLISDRVHKRRLLLIIPLTASIPGFMGITLFTEFSLILVSAAIIGFFVMGAGPIAFQYGAEIAYPVPEGSSFGMLMLTGQISGVLFVYMMDLWKMDSTGSFTPSLIILILFMILAIYVATKLKESTMIQSSSSNTSLNSTTFKGGV
ncbi:MFS transporter [Chengkuizengella axinellae]|uniref:MFS transporter n=1 Tax=Chengkuizengella axinellae TaxID=3064388 RepID=A0ABT9J086_9BACL|nr:MFS transporter [Chengkuizengella sp. 2205SS18-9]MDP5274992.1 MFS transporter [Chengkuizengella sp. 2205SS18-9]